MDRQTLFDYVKKTYSTEPDYPWADENAVLRHRQNRKWYGLVMEVSQDKLGLSGTGTVDILNLKCEPLLISSLRTQPGFFPAYHMNKEQWISIRLDMVSEETTKNLLALSWEMTGPKKRKRRKEGQEMRIAVTYENGMVFQHFGHTEAFKIYDADQGKVQSSQVVSTNGSGHGALAGFLAEHQVEVLICGGIGGGAQAALSQAGIRLYGGVTGSADEAVDAFLAGTLGYNPDVHCDHHEHHHDGGEHHCGDHGCGSHS